MKFFSAVFMVMVSFVSAYAGTPRGKQNLATCKDDRAKLPSIFRATLTSTLSHVCPSALPELSCKQLASTPIIVLYRSCGIEGLVYPYGDALVIKTVQSSLIMALVEKGFELSTENQSQMLAAISAGTTFEDALQRMLLASGMAVPISKKR